MRENEKARPAGGTAERATHGMQSTTTKNFCDDDTMGAARNQVIFQLLSVGAANAIPASALARMTGETPRQVTKRIEQLRKAGVPICANGDGFFLPENADELATYLRAFDRRVSQMQATRRALGVALALEQGQQTVEGWNDV